MNQNNSLYGVKLGRIVPLCAALCKLLKARVLSVRDQGVGGSNPLSPTNLLKQLPRVECGNHSVTVVKIVGTRVHCTVSFASSASFVALYASNRVNAFSIKVGVGCTYRWLITELEWPAIF